MARFATVGIDVSINSTGVAIVIYSEEEKVEKTIFFQICPWKTTVSGSVRLLTYKKTYADYSEYSDVDLHKIISADNLAKVVYRLINDVSRQYNIDYIDARQEGSVLATAFKKKQSRLNDLTIFNAAMKRMMLAHPLIKKISIIPPNSLKKYATGKGNCSKDLMETIFYEKNPDFHVPLKKTGKQASKNDDVADAWHLATAKHPENLKMIKS